jgi:hypothetical protein
MVNCCLDLVIMELARFIIAMSSMEWVLVEVRLRDLWSFVWSGCSRLLSIVRFCALADLQTPGGMSKESVSER